MISHAEARLRVQRVLAGITPPEGDEFVILDDATIERAFGWVFFYQSKRFMETDNFLYMLGGNAPFIVDRDTGEVHTTGTAEPIEHYIAAFERSRRSRT